MFRFLSTEKFGDVRICMISLLSFLLETVTSTWNSPQVFFVFGASTKQTTERRAAENGSNRDSSEAARSGRAADLLQTRYLPLEFPKAINPIRAHFIAALTSEWIEQEMSSPLPDPLLCNSPSALSGSRLCSTSES